MKLALAKTLAGYSMLFFGTVAVLVSQLNADLRSVLLPGILALMLSVWLFTTAKAKP